MVQIGAHQIRVDWVGVKAGMWAAVFSVIAYVIAGLVGFGVSQVASPKGFTPGTARQAMVMYPTIGAGSIVLVAMGVIWMGASVAMLGSELFDIERV